MMMSTQGKTNRSINFIFIAVLTALPSLLGLQKTHASHSSPKIFINQSADHPALNRNRQGIYDALKDAGINIDQVITLDMAQGNAATSGQIAQKFVGNSPDVMVGIGTLSSQSLVATSKTIPIVFTAVTDPLDAKLVSSVANPGKNVTGVSDQSPMEPQLNLFREIVPNLKRLGIVYNPGEVNSITSLKHLKEAASKMGIEIVSVGVFKTSEVTGAAASLVGKVDAFFVDNDNTVLAAFQGMVKIANQHKIPLFVSDTDIVEEGALAALGPNQYQLGRQTGEIILRILKGEKPGQMDVVYPQDLELVINTKAALKMGVISNDATSRKAKIIF